MLVEPREAPPRSSIFRLSPGSPARIHLATIYRGQPGMLRTEGIYCVSDESLTYCVAAPGQPCPTAFATSKGDENTLVTLKRVSPMLSGVGPEVWRRLDEPRGSARRR
jgi:hypothetical protein